MKAASRYLAASIIVAAAGFIYELFSHGVYSNYMIYAFMIPLTLGALPNIMAAGRSNKRGARRERSGQISSGQTIEGRISSGQTSAERISSRQVSAERISSRQVSAEQISAGLQLAAVITLTAGSLIKGALEIYGTTNILTAAYPVMGAVLLLAAAAAEISSRKQAAI